MLPNLDFFHLQVKTRIQEIMGNCTNRFEQLIGGGMPVQLLELHSSHPWAQQVVPHTGRHPGHFQQPEQPWVDQVVPHSGLRPGLYPDWHHGHPQQPEQP